MKKQTKRVLSAILCLVMVLSVIPMFHVTSQAAGGIEQRLNALRDRFPHGWYWNHKVTAYSNNGDQLMANWDESFSNSVTQTPCATHNGTASVGQYDCNFFDGGIQCFGFAGKIFYEVFGQRKSQLPQRTDKENVMKGDYIRINNNRHSAVVLSRNGNTISVVECNLDQSGESYNCYIRWDETYSVDAITYFMHATNYDEIDNDHVDLGSDFYAWIEPKTKVIHLENTGSNVQLTASHSDYDPKQIWHFLRQSDGSYKIVSEYDGNCLDLYYANTANATNIWTCEDNGSSAQRWFVFDNGGGYGLRTACGSSVMDVDNGKFIAGQNVWIYENNGSDAQRFTICKIDYYSQRPDKPSASTVSVKTLGLPNKTTTLSWTASALKDSNFDKRTYTLTLTKDGMVYQIKTGLTTTSINLSLPKGTYTAKVKAINTKYNDYYTVGNTITFTVKDCTHVWDGGTVTTPATCTATGIRTYKCISCGATKAETIGKTAHTITIINQKAATYDAAGYAGDEYCTVCKQTIKTGTVIPKLEKTDDPAPADPQPTSGCPWCGGTHSGFIGGIIGFFHRIFAALFGAKY